MVPETDPEAGSMLREADSCSRVPAPERTTATTCSPSRATTRPWYSAGVDAGPKLTELELRDTPPSADWPCMTTTNEPAVAPVSRVSTRTVTCPAWSGPCWVRRPSMAAVKGTAGSPVAVVPDEPVPAAPGAEDDPPREEDADRAPASRVRGVPARLAQ